MKKLLFITVLFSQFLFGQSDVIFEQANNLYNEGRYQEAINLYESIIDKGEHSSELYFNLGNAYYKLNSIAPSIYNYEKALRLNPKDKDVINNLSYANNMTIDSIETIPEIGFSKITKNIINVFSVDVWAILSITSMLAFVTFFLMYYFAYGTNKKRFMFLSSLTAIVVALVTLFLAFQKHNLQVKDKPAIVFAKEVQLKSEPNLRSDDAFELHEGTKVQIIETFDENWTKIKIVDGKTGWIANDAIKAL